MTDFPIKADADVPLALKAAQPGDTLKFAAGTYAPWRTSRAFAGPGVRVIGAPGAVSVPGKPDAQGRVQGPITFDTGAAGYAVEGFEVVAPDTGLAIYCANGAQRIALRNLDIHGAIVPTDQIPAKRSQAIQLGFGAVDCVVADCNIHHVGAGISVVARSGLQLLRNTVHDLVGDGLHVGPGAGALIEGNTVSRFFAGTALHNDALQIVTMGTSWPSDVVIRRNRFSRGDPAGTPVQGIFVQDDAKQGLTVLIEENCVSTGNWHGISLYGVAGGKVRSNYVGGDAGALSNGVPMIPWLLASNSPAVEWADNIATTRGQVTIPLAPAGDFSAADAWWTMLNTGTVPHLTDAQVPALEAQLADLTSRIAAVKAAVA